MDVLAIPATRECLDDARGFAAVPIERLIEGDLLAIVRKPFLGADMVREFTAEIVVQAALGQPGKELARELAEIVAAREAPDRLADLFRRRCKEVGQVRPNHGAERLHGCQLRHLAEIGAASSALRVVIDGIGECRRDVEEVRAVRDVDAKPVEVSGKVRPLRGKGDLGQQPEGMEEGGIARGVLEAALRCLGCGRSDDIQISARAKQIDDLPP
jgi:hypothetical protein